MLEGTLPFNNDNLKELFKTIQQGDYTFKSTFSMEAKDLINRMLQPNPLKRLTIEDIKQHVWFKKDLEPYLFDYKLIYSGTNAKEINEEIYQKLFEVGLDIDSKDGESIRNSILKGENKDF